MKPVPATPGGVRLGPALAIIGFLLAGLLLGTLLAFWQAGRAQLGPIPLPWGLILSWLLLILGVRVGISLTGTRWAGAAVFVGWLLATIAFATATPWAGDLIISAGARQFAYLLGGVVLGSAAASIPRSHRGFT